MKKILENMEKICKKDKFYGYMILLLIVALTSDWIVATLMQPLPLFLILVIYTKYKNEYMKSVKEK